MSNQTIFLCFLFLSIQISIYSQSSSNSFRDNLYSITIGGGSQLSQTYRQPISSLDLNSETGESQGSSFRNKTGVAAIVQGSQLPIILQQPQSITVNQDQSASLSIQVNGTGTIFYNWFKIGSGEIIGANSNTLMIASAQESDEGEYFCLVTDSKGSRNSTVATLTVNVRPYVQTISPDQSVLEQRSIKLSVTAGGDEPFSYRWFFGGQALFDSPEYLGVLQNELTIQAATPLLQGNYSCQINNPFGQIQSQSIFLTVIDPSMTKEGIRDHILGTYPLALEKEPFADQNQDGDVDIGDIQTLINQDN